LKPVVTLDAGSQKSPIHTIKFNQKLRDYLASGDGNGVVKIWQLNRHLTQVDIIAVFLCNV
jgi:hypothetical protein